MKRRGEANRLRWSQEPTFTVECLDPSCPWNPTGTEDWGFRPGPVAVSCGANPPSIAAMHHERTGHVVRVEKSVVTFYGESGPSQNRQYRMAPRARGGGLGTEIFAL